MAWTTDSPSQMTGQPSSQSLFANRWFVLAVLFSVRVTMAFQFQAVAALSPVYGASFGLELAEIGYLIGIYLAPGLIFAYPGGAIGRRFGDHRVISFSLLLMLAGALLMLWSHSWEGQLAGRFLAGIGGVLLNVLMSKVVADYFAGREIATAMGIFVNSWPVGIALALLVLPVVATQRDLETALILVVLVVLAGLLAFVFGVRPVAVTANTSGTRRRLTGRPLAAVIVAGTIWGFYNGALSMVFSFGPSLLIERGWTLTNASSVTSLTLWMVVISVPLGGYLSDRFNQRDGVMLGSFAVFAFLLGLAAHSDWVVGIFLLLGLGAGLAAGPIMSLPAAVLEPDNRAMGMGLYFTLSNIATVFSPILAGMLADWQGSATVTFYLGGGLLLLSVPALLLFRFLTGETTGPLAEQKLR
ncbi:MFS transporter [Rhodovibrionaceae bacterium A322]